EEVLHDGLQVGVLGADVLAVREYRDAVVGRCAADQSEACMRSSDIGGNERGVVGGASGVSGPWFCRVAQRSLLYTMMWHAATAQGLHDHTMTPMSNLTTRTLPVGPTV